MSYLLFPHLILAEQDQFISRQLPSSESLHIPPTVILTFHHQSRGNINSLRDGRSILNLYPPERNIFNTRPVARAYRPRNCDHVVRCHNSSMTATLSSFRTTFIAMPWPGHAGNLLRHMLDRFPLDLSGWVTPWLFIYARPSIFAFLSDLLTCFKQHLQVCAKTRKSLPILQWKDN